MKEYKKEEIPYERILQMRFPGLVLTAFLIRRGRQRRVERKEKE